MSNAQLAPGQYDGAPQDSTPHKAGAFDIRNVIAALIGFYGIVLIIMGFVDDTAEQRAKTGDVNANLWAGLVMAVVAAAFLVWSRLRPVVVDRHREPTDDRPSH
jgi:UDP-N-acetylmuramyl pentapeptide phosphotransferase/UDP-N-acetylglucosamine-1-phosphate transferase